MNIGVKGIKQLPIGLIIYLIGIYLLTVLIILISLNSYKDIKINNYKKAYDDGYRDGQYNGIKMMNDTIKETNKNLEVNL